MMRKIINDPRRFVDESIDGILAAHPSALRAASADRRALVRYDAPRAGKVGIVTGGGSGHLPVFLGYVGHGLCDGVAVGNVFSSPSAEVIRAATRAVSGGAGVLYLYGNYGGDIYNFDLAADLAETEGIPTRTVLATDDVASASPDQLQTRRGVAGMVFSFKIAGAAAERGYDLERVAAIARRVSENVRTMGVGLSPTILPAAGEPSFELDEGEMEVGIGIHGEPGVHRGALQTADEIADRLLLSVLDEFSLEPGSRVSVLVNGLGATPLEELYLLYRRVQATLLGRGLTVVSPLVGNYVTSLEMAGASISVLVLDDELAELLTDPAQSPFFVQGVVTGAAKTSGEAPARSEIPSKDAGTTGSERVGMEKADAPPAQLTALAALLTRVLARMPAHTDELRDLDAALGDGDLGITVALGSEAALRAIQEHPGVSDEALLREVGGAFAGGNPSTFAALVGGGVLYAASRLNGQSVLDRATLVRFARDVVHRIQERGGASLGDKTLLDALMPSIDLLAEGASSESTLVLKKMIGLVRSVIDGTASDRSQRGRAAWLQERSIGKRDPGMAAYLAFLTELLATITEQDEP